ncbi:Cysteine desulfurase [compost metagenome]
MEIAYNNLEEHNLKIKELRDYYVEEVKRRIPSIKINGDIENRLPGNSNISFENIEGEALLLNLDLIGIYASSGSACTSGSLDPSHVLKSIGLSNELSKGSLRISIGKYNTKTEVDYLLDNLVKIIEKLRKI